MNSKRMYYYYNSSITNETNPVIVYRLAPTLQSISKQIRDLKKLYPKQYKSNDIIKVFTQETGDGDLVLFGSYIFKKVGLTKCDKEVSVVSVTRRTM